jgi:hypothetical protein
VSSPGITSPVGPSARLVTACMSAASAASSWD